MTYHVEAEVDPGGTYMHLTAPSQLSGLMRELPGCKYVPGKKVWQIPLSWTLAVQMFGHLHGHVEMGPKLLKWVKEEKRKEGELTALSTKAGDPAAWVASSHGTHTLLPFQPSAIAFGERAGSWILADDPGSGKTVMAACWLPDGPSLVVCPGTVQGHWLSDLRTWRPEREHVILPRTAAARKKTLAAYAEIPEERRGALIIAYSQVALHSRLAPYGGVSLLPKEKEDKELQALSFAAMIVDEAHRAFNPKAKCTRGLWQMAKQVPQVLAMTGTPLESTPADVWALLHLVDPRAWPSRTRFLDLYCVLHEDHWGGVHVSGTKPETREELTRLMAMRIIRRGKALTLPHLPPKTYQTIEVELTPAQRKVYKSLETEMSASTDTGDIELYDPIAVHARLVQACAATLTVAEDGAIGLAMPSPKVTALLELLEDLGDAPCAVFSASRLMIELVSEQLRKARIQHSVIVGGQDATETMDALARYNSGRARVILISLGAGAAGISLTRGSTEIFLDRAYMQTMNKQAEDRMHGTGRGDSDADHLLIIDIEATETVEQRRGEILDTKADMFGQVFREVSDAVK